MSNTVSAPNLPAPPANQILARLTPDERDRLAPHVDRIAVALREEVYAAGGPVHYVYFPRTAVLSIIAWVPDGAACEIGVVGREGMSQLVAVFGANRSPHQVICQSPGELDRVEVGPFRQELARNGRLRELIDSYCHYNFVQIAQTTACNRHHTAPARCARWLLLMHDQVDGATFAMTHEFLSVMLGIRRPSVTLALASLQRAGAIGCNRGQITVTCRATLEQSACDCYGLPLARLNYPALTQTGGG